MRQILDPASEEAEEIRRSSDSNDFFTHSDWKDLFFEIHLNSQTYLFSKYLTRLKYNDNRESYVQTCVLPCELKEYKLIETEMDDTKKKVRDQAMSKDMVVNHIKKVISDQLFEEPLNEVRIFQDFEYEKYFAKRTFESLYRFKLTAEYSTRIDKAAFPTFDMRTAYLKSRISKKQTQIIQSWTLSSAPLLRNYAEEKKKFTSINHSIYWDQIELILVGHIVKLIRNTLAEIFCSIADRFKGRPLCEVFQIIELSRKSGLEQNANLVEDPIKAFANFFLKESPKVIVESNETMDVISRVHEEIRNEIGYNQDMRKKHTGAARVLFEYNSTKRYLSMLHHIMNNMKPEEAADFSIENGVLELPEFDIFFQKYRDCPAQCIFDYKALIFLEYFKNSPELFKRYFDFSFEESYIVGADGIEEKDDEPVENDNFCDCGSETMYNTKQASLMMKSVQLPEDSTHGVVSYDEYLESYVFDFIMRTFQTKIFDEAAEEQVKGILFYAKNQNNPSKICRILTEMERCGMVFVSKRVEHSGDYDD